MAERFGLPVVTLVDTVGAWPTFECERDGQSEVTNLSVCLVTCLLKQFLPAVLFPSALLMKLH
jgi:acetyl-CoA carboxylase alpha subunit